MSDLKLVIGNKNYSSWSLRPWFFLKQLNIDFEEEMVFLYEDNMEANLEPYFSNGKVPLLVDREVDSNTNKGFQVWDSLAIIEYANDKFSNQQGWPSDLHARAVARAVSAEMHSGFFAIRNDLSMDCKAHYPNHPISASAQQEINRVIEIWESCKHDYGKSGPWLFGEFSGADAMFAPIAIRFSIFDVKLSGYAREYVELVLQNEHIKNWMEAGRQETQFINFDTLDI